MQTLVEKRCRECNKKLIGRADKKFCSDQCRTSFNNRLNSDENNYVRNVNNILRRNRRILKELNKTGKSKVSRERLHEKGFDFLYHTSSYKTKEGSIYYYCYDQGYLSVENNYYLLVVRKEYR